MPRMTLEALTEEVRDYIPNKPMSKIARAANTTLREIGRHIGPVERSTLTTKALYQGTDGSIGAGSTAFASALSSFTHDGETNQLIRIDGSEIWFNIAAVPSVTGLTLSSPWAGVTGSNLAFTVAYPLFSFPDDVLEIINIGIPGHPSPRRISDDRQYDRRWRNEPSDRVTDYVQRAFGYNGRMTIQWVPPFITSQVLEYTYRAKPQYFDGEDEQSVSDYPDIYSDAITFGTLHLLWDQEDAQDRSMYWFQKFQKTLMEVLGQDITRAEGQYERAIVFDDHFVRTQNKTPIQ